MSPTYRRKPDNNLRSIRTTLLLLYLTCISNGSEPMTKNVQSKLLSLLSALVVLATLLFTIGCSATASAPGGFPPPVVEVVAVEQRDIPTYREWIGTLDGYVNAPIKAQVNGYLLRQNYIEGSFVAKGQLLFEIDPRPFQAAVDQAEGQLAQANGQLATAKAQLIQAGANLTSSEATQHRTQLDVEKAAHRWRRRRR